MGLSQRQLNAGIDALAERDANFARALGNAGYPEPRIRAPGYTTLLRTIVGQQVSVAAATSIWNKLETQFGEGCPAEVIAAADFDTLRACGLSGQKQGYAKSLAQLILDGELTFDALPADDGAQQRRIARRADARFGVAGVAERAREIGVAFRQRVDPRVQLLLAKAHRIFSFCSGGS